LLIPAARAQSADVTLQLNEQFFEALLDALFKNSSPPEFPLGVRDELREYGENNGGRWALGFAGGDPSACRQTIKLLREVNGTRTAVQFREGRIFAPIAFSGDYNPPLIGCVDFAGVAETTIDLEYDAARRTLLGRAKVSNVNLSGSGGVGGGILARMIQGSIDRKINPIQILSLDKVSFVVPVQNAGSLRMQAVGITPEIAGGNLNVRVKYEFHKAD
jgi:hypothetical protein